MLFPHCRIMGLQPPCLIKWDIIHAFLFVLNVTGSLVGACATVKRSFLFPPAQF